MMVRLSINFSTFKNQSFALDLLTLETQQTTNATV